ncbi:848085d9-cc7d-4464-b83f-758ec383f167 [Thermothielavioides terrestris]|uniref:Enhancer of mRNA-decapping protein 3 n=1 Tax=Thermothielavioides terrestris TaxID=2587410 RepID=A0A446BJH0_9PEZI|nr:848085d9-cc7d-4464-b83f-758ec383f167 [Thermothielavioides terrestris]
MAAEFVGLQMVVTLHGVPPRRLKGTISDVEAGAGLTLSNVWMLDTNEWKPRLTIPSKDIADVTQVPTVPPPNAVPVAAPSNSAPPPPAPAVAQQPPRPTFVDPAIVAVGKPPSAVPPPSRAPELSSLPGLSTTTGPAPVVHPTVQVASTSREVTPTSAVAANFKGLKLRGDSATAEAAQEVEDAEAPLDFGEVVGQQKTRRVRKARNAKPPTREQDDASPAPSAKTAGRGKGWRQTPILQSTASFQPFDSLKRNGKGRHAVDSGWASEDVTDVQEMGDFDFEGGLAKFDKQNLFAQMRKDDLIDEAERLVSHNRLPRPKPGTGGGKNLHYSENVLDMPSTIHKATKDRPTSKETPNDFWNSEADDGLPNNSERLSGRDLGMGSRQSSRRGESKGTAGRRSQSRKANEMARTASGPSRVNSGVSHYRAQPVRGSRPSSRLSSRPATADKRKQLPTPAAAQGLYVLPSNRRIETVSALQMLNLENIAHNEIGLTEEMMTENAGRGIAEVTLTALADPAIKVRLAGSVDPATGASPPPPAVVVLAGNNKSGSRAVAAARHLRNKGVNVLVCVAGLERGERDLLEDVQQQVRLYRNLGGRVFTKTDFFEHLRKISIPTLTIDTPRTSSSLSAPAPPVALIVDALLGLAISFDELRNADQATVYELIEWANRNEAFVLSLDVPSGIDPSSGAVSVVDGARLYVKPRYVVAVGAPKRGLLEALVAADNDDGDKTVLAGADGAGAGAGGLGGGGGGGPLCDDAVLEWKLFLVDMGLGQAVWKKAGTRMRRGVDFGERWVLEMVYRGSLPAEEADEEEV